MHTIEYKITVSELRKKYLESKGEHEATFFCLVLKECVTGYHVRDSQQVISEFVKAQPKRFKSEIVSALLPYNLLAKYATVKDPRLALLDSLPDDYEFTFEMRKWPE